MHNGRSQSRQQVHSKKTTNQPNKQINKRKLVEPRSLRCCWFQPTFRSDILESDLCLNAAFLFCRWLTRSFTVRSAVTAPLIIPKNLSKGEYKLLQKQTNKQTDYKWPLYGVCCEKGTELLFSRAVASILLKHAKQPPNRSLSGGRGTRKNIFRVRIRKIWQDSLKLVCGEATETRAGARVARGVWGACSPRNVWNLEALKCHFWKPIQVLTWSR